MCIISVFKFFFSGIFLRLLLSFSAVDNGKKILSVDKASLESIKCIHGLRFFSIGWIIMVHSYLEVFAIADNKNLRILTERGFMYQTISNATFSVDTFFFIRYRQNMVLHSLVVLINELKCYSSIQKCSEKVNQ